jgi:phospholipase/carboxylesterase
MSGYLPLEAVFSAEASPANRELPILMFHGEQDPTLPVELGRLSRDTLRAAGYQVDWHSYPAMGHSICAEEIDVISGWLGYVLA